VNLGGARRNAACSVLPDQEAAIATIGKRLADRDRAADARAEIVGPAAPIPSDRIRAPQRCRDLAMAYPGTNRVERAQRHRPALRATLGGIERARKSPEPLQRRQPLQGGQLRFDARRTGEIVMQPDRPIEHAAAPHLDLDVVQTVAEPNVLSRTACPQDDGGMATAANVEDVAAARGNGLCLDRQNGRIGIGTPENDITRPGEAGWPGESATPRAARRR
jgi:hypothetical protein